MAAATPHPDPLAYYVPGIVEKLSLPHGADRAAQLRDLHDELGSIGAKLAPGDPRQLQYELLADIARVAAELPRKPAVVSVRDLHEDAQVDSVLEAIASGMAAQDRERLGSLHKALSPLLGGRNVAVLRGVLVYADSAVQSLTAPPAGGARSAQPPGIRRSAGERTARDGGPPTGR